MFIFHFYDFCQLIKRTKSAKSVSNYAHASSKLRRISSLTPLTPESQADFCSQPLTMASAAADLQDFSKVFYEQLKCHICESRLNAGEDRWYRCLSSAFHLVCHDCKKVKNSSCSFVATVLEVIFAN